MSVNQGPPLLTRLFDGARDLDPHWQSFFKRCVTGLDETGALLDHVFKIKASATSRANNDTETDDPDLIFPVLAGQVWAVDCCLFVAGGTTGDFNWQFSIPAGSTGTHSGVRLVSSASDTSGTVQLSAVADPTSFRSAGMEGSNLVMVLVKAVIRVAIDGNIALAWAQSVSNGTATVLHANSYLEARRIA